MGKLTIFLDTEAETFASWLESSYQSVEIESSLPWSRLRLRAERHTVSGKSLAIEWGGDSENRDAEGNWIAEPLLSPVIWFGMTSLDNNLEVQAGCTSIDAMVCFLEILGDIVHPQRWPGAREDVLKYLGEVTRAEEEWKYFDKRVIDKAQALRAELLAQQKVEGPESRPDTDKPARTEEGGEPGRQPLKEENWEEYIYRLAMAEWAEETKKGDKTWADVAEAIGWKYGNYRPAVKKLYRARKELEKVKKQGDKFILQEIARKLAELKT